MFVFLFIILTLHNIIIAFWRMSVCISSSSSRNLNIEPLYFSSPLLHTTSKLSDTVSTSGHATTVKNIHSVHMEDDDENENSMDKFEPLLPRVTPTRRRFSSLDLGLAAEQLLQSPGSIPMQCELPLPGYAFAEVCLMYFVRG